jgi:hypothetical protein
LGGGVSSERRVSYMRGLIISLLIKINGYD